MHHSAIANVKLILVYNNSWIHLDPANKEFKRLDVLCPGGPENEALGLHKLVRGWEGAVQSNAQ